MHGCQQEDADAFCRLKTGNPNSSATTFNITAAQVAPGICCPPPESAPGTLECIELANFANRGVNLIVSVHDTDLTSTHSNGAVVTEVVCSNP